MSQAFNEHSGSHIPRHRPQLEAVPPLQQDPEPFFPTSLSGIEPAEIARIDREALTELGSLGPDRAMKVLDSWVRFTHTTQKALDATEGLDERALRVHQAARYIAKLRHKTVLQSDGLPYGIDNYRGFPMYRFFSERAQHNATERMPQDQLQTAKIVLSAVKMYRSLVDPLPRTAEKQALFDKLLAERKQSRTAPARRSTTLIHRDFPELPD